MKIIYSNILAFRGFAAMNICGILFVRKGCKVNTKMIRHEAIHTIQIKELLYVFFYLFYALEWFTRVVTFQTKPYKNISFEQEAYSNENYLDYLKERKHFAWIKYLVKKRNNNKTHM